MSKPLEFKIVKYDLINKAGKPYDDYYIVFMSEEEQESIHIPRLPKGLELNKHYFIGDLYGEPVVDDRKGL